MGQVPFHRKPSFRATALAILLAAVYLYNIIWKGGLSPNIWGILLDLILLFAFFQVCLFFYAQFTLPVRTLHDRARMRARLLLHARDAHGPAIFVRNGRVLQRTGETQKQGPGLLWVDTASALMMRSDSGFKHVLGPGIHFVDSKERIDSVFSLHAQTYSIGPGPDEPIYRKPGEGASEEERRAFEEAQAKRMAVSGRTRDGHEVVPVLRIGFKLDASPARPGSPGSRFGFMKEAVERAARGQGVNASSSGQLPRHVAWNQLPGLIAVDLWREYLGKFTLDELFTPSLPSLPEVLQPEVPIAHISVPQSPFVVRRNFPARILRRLNSRLEALLDERGITEGVGTEGQFAQRPIARTRRASTEPYTALQIIDQMLNARMTQAVVPILDECGRVTKGHTVSEEFKRLRERGLVVDNVTIESLRFDPTVEDQIVQQWNTSWLANAAKDRRHIEQLEMLAEQAGRQQALVEHASALSHALGSARPRTISDAAKSLIQACQSEILADERLYGRASGELESLSQLLKWVESTENE